MAGDQWRPGQAFCSAPWLHGSGVQCTHATYHQHMNTHTHSHTHEHTLGHGGGAEIGGLGRRLPCWLVTAAITGGLLRPWSQCGEVSHCQDTALTVEHTGLSWPGPLRTTAQPPRTRACVRDHIRALSLSLHTRNPAD